MHSKKKLLSIALAVTVFIAGTVLVLEKKGVIDLLNNNPSFVINNGETINYGPPTEDEKRAADEQKDKIVRVDTPSHDNNQSKRSANVIITDAGQYDSTIEVRAFIQNHYQDGTCTITFLKDGNKVEKSTLAYRDATTTVCTNPLFPREEFKDSGDWHLTVTYASESAYGVSQPQIIRID